MSQLKRSLSAIRAEDDDSDDETPLFSPSPSISDSEDDQMATSLHRPLRSGNVGRDLLLKMGWKEGIGLGVGGFGRIEPVPISDKRGGDLTGIGKMSLDTRIIASSTASRRTLESERQLHETEAEREARIDLTEMKQAQREDVNQALRTYRCDLCQKQYDRPSTFEAHLNSYDHHHRKRFMEMKQTQKGKTEATGVLEKKREREKKREEKELAKMAEAAGIQWGSTSAGSRSSSEATAAVVQSAPVPATGVRKGGWKKVAAIETSAGLSTPSSVPVSSSTSGWKKVSVPKALASASLQSTPAPAILKTPFQSSGLSTLETSQEAQRNPNPALVCNLPPPPPEDDPPPLPS